MNLTRFPHVLLGIILVIIGVIGLLVPIMPGWFFIFPGLAFIFPEKGNLIATRVKKRIKAISGYFE